MKEKLFSSTTRKERGSLKREEANKAGLGFDSGYSNTYEDKNQERQPLKSPGRNFRVVHDDKLEKWLNHFWLNQLNQEIKRLSSRILKPFHSTENKGIPGQAECWILESTEGQMQWDGATYRLALSVLWRPTS